MSSPRRRVFQAWPAQSKDAALDRAVIGSQLILIYRCPRNMHSAFHPNKPTETAAWESDQSALSASTLMLSAAFETLTTAATGLPPRNLDDRTSSLPLPTSTKTTRVVLGSKSRISGNNCAQRLSSVLVGDHSIQWEIRVGHITRRRPTRRSFVNTADHHRMINVTIVHS